MSTNNRMKAARAVPNEPREELLTADEVAVLLKVTVRTVERWQQDGVLPFLRLGHAVRFHWPAVVQHLTANFTVVRAGLAPVSDHGSRGLSPHQTNATPCGGPPARPITKGGRP
jgi:excisionase family DNA binding protein